MDISSWLSAPTKGSACLFAYKKPTNKKAYQYLYDSKEHIHKGAFFSDGCVISTCHKWFRLTGTCLGAVGWHSWPLDLQPYHLWFCSLQKLSIYVSYQGDAHCSSTLLLLRRYKRKLCFLIFLACQQPCKFLRYSSKTHMCTAAIWWCYHILLKSPE